ncbi:PhzF family phenazine biosynthesis protein [Anaerosolibacter carboniphilus]|uniref:PhzF family phenazine biosynthesis protein n=1 Tax=Anaerosolibacter carboniphilus TaxID=1417629 RepID=A0A841KU01_9FIRM|nr:PhzF family phenazine biosynthesis isomerase [Anaerosolibacter carboniphilus]MBB6217184.1 PhzF family phenazine biosynthesis protein [Anaerosolibacter carboniphilus]
MRKYLLKKFRIYHVDAFTTEALTGNPAAVCILEESIPDESMQAIAFEMNVSETAFVIPKTHLPIDQRNVFSLRWFTPMKEVPLCGHATLASSVVLFDDLSIPYDEITYETKSGPLVAKKDPLGIALDFPLDKPIEAKFPHKNEILQSMGIIDYQNIFIGQKTKKLVIHLHSAHEVRSLNPNFEKMKNIPVEDIKGVGVTAGADASNYDCITRYFNPWAGVNEDPVTGSVHTLLGYYWAELLDKKVIYAYQASQRGGEIILRLKENMRIELIGKAVIVDRY